MHGDWDLPVWIASSLTVVICVLLHYEVIRAWITLLRRYHPPPRVGLPCTVLGMILSHGVQIMLFAFTMHILYRLYGQEIGALVGSHQGLLTDSIYFSLIVFTTVGFGDITPVGPIRILVGVEALTGLVLITWSASFTFLIMQWYFREQIALQDEQKTTDES